MCIRDSYSSEWVARQEGSSEMNQAWHHKQTVRANKDWLKKWKLLIEDNQGKMDYLDDADAIEADTAEGFQLFSVLELVLDERGEEDNEAFLNTSVGKWIATQMFGTGGLPTSGEESTIGEMSEECWQASLGIGILGASLIGLAVTNTCVDATANRFVTKVATVMKENLSESVSAIPEWTQEESAMMDLL